MRKKSLIKLNLILALVFVIILAVILIAINPFKANIFLIILFYVALFGLFLTVLNLISNRLKFPWWLRILISISIIFILMVQACRL